MRAKMGLRLGLYGQPSLAVLGNATPDPPANTALPVVTGTAQVGQTLAASTGSWTNSPTSYTYQWMHAPSSAISGANSSTYVITTASIGQQIRCQVTAINGGGSASAISLSTAAVIAAGAIPENTVAPALSGTFQVGQTVSCSDGTWTNTPTGYAYQWRRGGVDISGATAATRVLTEADIGAVMSCRVTATNAMGSASTLSNNSSAVLALAPINTTLPVITGTAQQGENLFCSTGSWVNVPVSYAYQWKRDGANIGGATTNSYTPTIFDVGVQLTCVVSATNTGGTGNATSAATAAVLPLPPTYTIAPSLSGTAQVGQMLLCDEGTWNNSPTFAFEWYADNVLVAGQSASTIVLTGAELNKVIDCKVTATNAAGSAFAYSNESAAVLPAAPSNTIAPVVSGTVQEGNALSCTTGTWAGSVTSYAYQWKRGATNISGATGSSHTLVDADIGQNISCVVTATNAGGSGNATSNSVGPVLTAAPVNTAAPVISGTILRVGRGVTCSTGTWSNSPTSYAYQWVNLSSGPISGATSSAYTLQADDEGDDVFCVVTASNSFGSDNASADGVGPIEAYVAPLSAVVLIDAKGANGTSNVLNTVNVPAGAEIYVFMACRGSTGGLAAPTVNSSPSLTWTLCTNNANDSQTAKLRHGWYKATFAAGGDITITGVGGANTGKMGTVAAYIATGANTSVSANKVAGSGDTGGDHSVALPSAPHPASTVFSGACAGGTAAFTVPAGYSTLFSGLAGSDLSIFVGFDQENAAQSFNYISANSNSSISGTVEVADAA
jgi:hypothetical protein